MKQPFYHFLTWPILAILAALLAACVAITRDDVQSGSALSAEPTASAAIDQRAVLAWQRADGRAGFCDDVMIYRGGAVYVSSCRGQSAEPNQLRLNSAQLTTLYTWLDTFAPFNVTYPSVEQRDGMSVTLTFMGGGEEPVTEPIPTLMMDFAQNLFNESRMAQQVLPAGCMAPDAERQILIDEAAGYCLLYPAAYSLWQQNEGTTEIISDTVMNHITPRASISVEEAADRTLDAVVKQMLADYAPPGFNLTPITITVDGVAAVLLDEVPGQDLTRRVVLIHNGRLYTLFFAPIGEQGTETRQQAEALYQTIIESFHLLPPAETDSGVHNATPSATDATLDHNAVLRWEGQPLFAEDAAACGRLTIDRSGMVTLGRCGERAGETQPLGDTHQREWLELQARLWGPTEVELIGHKLLYRPDGEAQGGAWQRALVAWAQLVHAELATGQVSASGATALHWLVGPVPAQPESCRQLTVLRYGYAYAATAPCTGGPTQTQLGDWLTDAEMIQFDIWLHQFSDLYVADNYLVGRGERTANEAERAEVAAWAEQVYARLAAQATPPAKPELGAWQRYQADSGYAIAYPLSLYSLRPAQQSAAEVLFPGVRVVEPNDAFVYRQPGQSTYKLSIAVRANEQGRTLAPDLLTNSVLIAYGADVLAGQPIQEIELDGVPALRVDDLPVGPTGITAHIVALYQDRIYELMIEPHAVTTNLATPYIAGASNAANQALIEEVLATFRFVE
ncbi:MAG: hypothetical protein DYG89_27925 [Caldilinea sp. CFX5]|nr:hypothetical protein [Caldilinea sp. CFX5]